MLLKQADLARRLGVNRSSVARAVLHGKLQVDPTGRIDTDDPGNKAYLARWTAHRGKQRADPAPVSPDRAAAMLRRASSKYARDLARYQRRKADHLPADIVYCGLDNVFTATRDALAESADTVNLTEPDLERELERIACAALRAHETRDPRTSALYRPGDPAGPQPPVLPDDVSGRSLDDVRALLDILAGARHDLEAGIEAGWILSKDEARRISSGYITTYLNAGVGTFPRRHAQGLAAVLVAQGPEGAREYLRTAIADEVERLERPMREIREKGEAYVD